ncbi:hypothetical protein OUZ56_015941 [Daphnia magna]|uniref:F5/8 type C domain-containing protein n=1 Tax=Daphnia magna TaxID=35525 RepID=A0ABR0AP73_9CRUS|nr:hypothetical protein OUZ56_015941 [Daphnia magna]
MECVARRRCNRRDLRAGGCAVTAPAVLLLMTVIMVPLGSALDASQCVGALGMESGSIRDEDIAASSSFDGASVGPQNARVRVERNGGAWCPRQQATHQPRDWLEIDLKTDHVITAVETQGRFGNGQGQEFAEHFLLEYWRESLAKWVRYKDTKSEEHRRTSSFFFTVMSPPHFLFDCATPFFFLSTSLLNNSSTAR